MSDQENKASGYDKLVNWKIFSIPVILFLILLMMPTPYGMFTTVQVWTGP